jgi:hypothetical protein
MIFGGLGIINVFSSQMPVCHVYDPSYVGAWDWEEGSWFQFSL